MQTNTILNKNTGLDYERKGKEERKEGMGLKTFFHNCQTLQYLTFCLGVGWSWVCHCYQKVWKQWFWVTLLWLGARSLSRATTVLTCLEMESCWDQGISRSSHVACFELPTEGWWASLMDSVRSAQRHTHHATPGNKLPLCKMTLAPSGGLTVFGNVDCRLSINLGVIGYGMRHNRRIHLGWGMKREPVWVTFIG